MWFLSARTSSERGTRPWPRTVGYGTMRQGRPGQRGKFVQVEARMSQTGANADEWVYAKPGTEGLLALGLAHVMISEKLRPAAAAGEAGAQLEGWSKGLADYTPESVAKLTGVEAAKIRAPGAGNGRARAGSGAHRRSAAGADEWPGQRPGGQRAERAAGKRGEAGWSFVYAAAAHAGPWSGKKGFSVGALCESILKGSSPVKTLLVYDANPVFASPPAWHVREALEKVPFIASFGSFVDETSILADLILPDHSYLESWVDSVPESGTTQAVASLAPPAMHPLHHTRAMPDVLLDVAHQLGGQGGQSAAVEDLRGDAAGGL